MSLFHKIKSFFAEKPQSTPKKVVNYKLTTSLDEYDAEKNFYARAIQRTAESDVVKTTAADGTVLAMDSAFSENNIGAIQQIQLPTAVMNWYGAQSFIGYTAAAIIAQHWLVFKCCNVPAKDAIRKGYEITVNDGTDVAPEVLDAMRKADARYRINYNLERFITMGRIFGIRIAMYKVESPDPNYYVKPFNIDGITPGSYKGIVQIDPYWCTPELDMEAAANPGNLWFYDPTWWVINNKRVHRTHLVIMRNGEVADILKPTYLYGGVPLPQFIYERVYCAERTANEAPQLTLSKRATIFKLDTAQGIANQADLEAKIRIWSHYRDNFGVKIVGLEEEIQQFETSLADLDAVIMTQYQLVAAVANIPATKLLGTTPKGFNSTGDHEESSYHEELESIQATWLTALLEGHHMRVMRSEIAPKFGIEPFETTVTWNTLDSVNATELAVINKSKAETGQALILSGAIDGQDERQRIVNDPQSGYSGLDHSEELSLEGGDPIDDPNDSPELEEGVQ